MFKDAPKGVEAANTVGMSYVVIAPIHAKEQFRDYDNIIHLFRIIHL